MIAIDGQKIAEEILGELQKEVSGLNFKPVFCDIFVGEDSVSAQYVKMKARKAQSVGFEVLQANFPTNITTEELVAEIKTINQKENMCGLIVQLPLPAHLDKLTVLNAIDPRIDVDCIGEKNAEKFYQGQGRLQFPTAMAIMKILDSVGEDSAKKIFLVIGQGQLVGRPVSFLLEQKGCQYQTATNQTQNLDELIKNADVVISATGQPNLLTGEKIKPGAIIIDAGTSEANSGAGIVGDVDFKSVAQVASFVSPVPGGVGPVTVACLLTNVLQVAKLHNTNE